MEPDRARWVRTDFNGLLASDLLCLSHSDEVTDRVGHSISLEAGLVLTAYDDDADENGQPDAIFASGQVEVSPEYSHHAGSKWCLRIDADGIRHESDV